MKLYTLGSEKNSLIQCENNYFLHQEEFSIADYKKFMNQGKTYYVNLYHCWYETDMNDSSSDTSTANFTINHNNMIIKDNKLFGVLLKTGNLFPKYYVYKFGEKTFNLELAGGYNENSFKWTFKENDLQHLEVLNTSLDYLLIKENYSFDIKNNANKLVLYTLEIISFLQKDCILENDKVVGFMYEKNKYLINDSSTHCLKTVTTDESYGNLYKKTEKYTLIHVTEEFLEQNIVDVPYDSYRNNKYKVFSNIYED